MIDLKALTFDDFSGGITDDYVDTDINTYQKADNLYITNKKKLHQRPGSVLFNTSTETVGNRHWEVITSGQRIGLLINHDHTLVALAVSASKVFQRNTSLTAWSELSGPASGAALPSSTTANRVCSSPWNQHTYLTSDSLADRVVKMYRGALVDTTLKLRTAGLPKITDYAASVTITPDTAGTVKTYIYAFHYFYSYTVDGTTFEDNGATYTQTVTTLKDITDAVTDATAQVVITAIPYISPALNWDVANVKVKVFRTIDGGTTLYHVGTITPVAGVYPSFTDDYIDDASIAAVPNYTRILTNQATIYTDGGVVDNDPVPFCKYLHVANDIGWYANVLEKIGASYEPYAFRVRQSIPGDPDSAPESFFVDLEEEITGISSRDAVPVVFCKNSIYRIDGYFDELGRGGAIAQKISSTIGCISHLSIVQTPEGLFFAGNDGFYFTDGYRIAKLSQSIDDTYRDMTRTALQKKGICGLYDLQNRRVYWSVQTDQSGSDVDTLYLLELSWGLKPESSFTTWSGGASFAPTALLLLPHAFSSDLSRERAFLRADSRGYIFAHDETLKNDPLVDVGASPTTWKAARIDYEFRSCATNFGIDILRKWVPKIQIKCKGESNLSLGITSLNDDHRSEKALAPIRMRKFFAWGDPDVVWGDPNMIWHFQGFIEEVRRFPSGGLRCSYKQMVLTNGEVFVTKSDTRGLAVCAITSGVERSLILVNSAAHDWPEGAVGMNLSFEADGYVKQYAITAFPNGDEIRFNDPSNMVPLGSSIKWEIKGKPQNEIIHLLGFNIFFSPFSQSVQPYQSDVSYTGGNS